MSQTLTFFSTDFFVQNSYFKITDEEENERISSKQTKIKRKERENEKQQAITLYRVSTREPLI